MAHQDASRRPPRRAGSSGPPSREGAPSQLLSWHSVDRWSTAKTGISSIMSANGASQRFVLLSCLSIRVCARAEGTMQGCLWGWIDWRRASSPPYFYSRRRPGSAASTVRARVQMHCPVGQPSREVRRVRRPQCRRIGGQTTLAFAPERRERRERGYWLRLIVGDAGPSPTATPEELGGGGKPALPVTSISSAWTLTRGP